jgi:hypothetical protein
MNLQTKTKLAGITIWVIVVTISIIVLFFFGFLITNTFDLQVFANQTTDFIWILFAASMVVVICGAFLNISLNIGIIADSKLETSEGITGRSTLNRKILLIVVLIMVVVGGFLFLGDFLTRQGEKNNLIAESEEILSKYDKSVSDITASFLDTTLLVKVPEILKFLESQKQEFPSIILITSEFYKGQTTYLEISSSTEKENLKKEFYNYSFYPCNKNDCDFLRDVFKGTKKDYYYWSEKNNYRLYYPIINGPKKYILLFSKYERYGKIGS